MATHIHKHFEDGTDTLTDSIRSKDIYSEVIRFLDDADLFIEIDSAVKRTIDIIGSLLGLILTFPIFLLFAILIKLDSKGPVFYLQERVGCNRRQKPRRASDTSSVFASSDSDRRQENNFGKNFKLIKFRSMVADAEKNSGPVWATENDSRITRLGKFMRKTRLDEFPQLINVLKGDMSLVGPRPERAFFIKDFVKKIPGYELRLRVKPGITGLAQVEGGYDTSLATVVKKVGRDLDYIYNWSLKRELKIILKTVLVVLTTRGAL